MKQTKSTNDPLLHLLFGGALETIRGVRFRILKRLDIVRRYFIVHLRGLLQSEAANGQS